MKKVICSEKAPGAIGPYSQAIEANGMVFVSGQLPIDAATGKMAEGIEEQARQSLENIKHILEETGLTMGNIVKTTVFLQDMSFFAGMNGIYATYFDGAFPARSAVAVKALPKDALVEIECIAVRSQIGDNKTAASHEDEVFRGAVFFCCPYGIHYGRVGGAFQSRFQSHFHQLIFRHCTFHARFGEIVGGVFRQQFQNTADILVADHAEYNMQFLIQLFVYILQLLANTFKAINVVACVTDEVRIALEFLPASHQTGHLAYIRESGIVIFITDFISQVL